MFQCRVQIPQKEYKEMVEKIKDSSDIFGRWFLKSESSPIELLILGSFRYLGRGLAFDDLEEYTGISNDVVHC
jgi:hypothetical protein